MSGTEKELKIVQNLLEKINIQFQHNVIPATDIIGNLTVSFSVRKSGSLDTQYSVVGDIIPVEIVKGFQLLMESLLDQSANNVRTLN